ncbi:heterokaryon incompatibility protein-domain-containing protein, partial [Lasiosphaeria hispida]
ARLPTRLLDVSNPHTLRLVPGEGIRDGRGGRYIALSHCWGELEPDEVHRYCTTKQNIHDREGEGGFSLDSLPLTLQDAIKVTQALEVRYLWIDSLCIIQGDSEDWNAEAKRMDAVYASAYCTIAATSATNSKSSFLKRDISNEYMHVRDDSGRRAYICNNVADFDQEVRKALLSSREWVLQERMLSRRTVHFSARQMYFGCREGVCCEVISRNVRITEKFINYDTFDFLRSFLENYPQRGLPKPTDRAVAISSLAARLASVFSCEERNGIFEVFLHRTLLWTTREGPQKLKRIRNESDKVPSWSWMACERPIQFPDIE